VRRDDIVRSAWGSTKASTLSSTSAAACSWARVGVRDPVLMSIDLVEPANFVHEFRSFLFRMHVEPRTA
jgi:hypothetical protein